MLQMALEYLETLRLFLEKIGVNFEQKCIFADN